jgi:hypothetical protein
MENTTITRIDAPGEVRTPVRNTEFSYMYRDASNYKKSGSVVLVGVITPELEQRLKKTLDGGRLFIAGQVSVPEVFLWNAEMDYDSHNPPADLKKGEYVISDDDHCWHEFTGVFPSEDDVFDKDGRTIDQFVAAFESAAAEGWNVFDPADRAPAAVRDRLRGC